MVGEAKPAGRIEAALRQLIPLTACLIVSLVKSGFDCWLDTGMQRFGGGYDRRW